MFSSSFVPQMFCHPVTRVFPCFFCFCCFLDNSPQKNNKTAKQKTHTYTYTPVSCPKKITHNLYIHNLSIKHLSPCRLVKKSRHDARWWPKPKRPLRQWFGASKLLKTSAPWRWMGLDGWNIWHDMIWVFPKKGYPQIIHFNKVFHYKPSILGYHYFRKHPYVRGAVVLSISVNSTMIFPYTYTPQKLTAKAPENGWLEYYLPFWGWAYFQVLC